MRKKRGNGETDLLGTKKIAIWATDQEKYLLFEDYANLNTGVNKGSVIPKGDTAFIAMKENRSIERIVPKEIFGRELRTFVVPVENGTTEKVAQSTEALDDLADKLR